MTPNLTALPLTSAASELLGRPPRPACLLRAAIRARPQTRGRTLGCRGGLGVSRGAQRATTHLGVVPTICLRKPRIFSRRVATEHVSTQKGQPRLCQCRAQRRSQHAAEAEHRRVSPGRAARAPAGRTRASRQGARTPFRTGGREQRAPARPHVTPSKVTSAMRGPLQPCRKSHSLPPGSRGLGASPLTLHCCGVPCVSLTSPAEDEDAPASLPPATPLTSRPPPLQCGSSTRPPLHLAL